MEETFSVHLPQNTTMEEAAAIKADVDSFFEKEDTTAKVETRIVTRVGTFVPEPVTISVILVSLGGMYFFAQYLSTRLVDHKKAMQKPGFWVDDEGKRTVDTVIPDGHYGYMNPKTKEPVFKKVSDIDDLPGHIVRSVVALGKLIAGLQAAGKST
ncbi:hypothetical protein [Boseongicola sp. H5]|uniref:hypothetical protein n=1 Tax=Boseongicola sp. H5 TaxID=2763261 RepID=UPI001D09FCD3|nr:hypothetical protein [Boseongicola sp. H5]